MKSINNYIQEALINRNTKIVKYHYYPKDKKDLKFLIKQLLEERGKDADLNDIDVSNITDMSWIFEHLDPHNIDISNWDVSNVENMEGMFYGCKNFTSDLSNWNVKNIENMLHMFYGCENFNSNLSDWKVINVENMREMFDGCTSLKNKPKWYKE